VSKSVLNDPRLTDLSPIARLLGRQVVSASDDGTVELRFEATDSLTNRIGTVQGGILSTMLDSAFGLSVLATLPAGRFPVTISMNVSYFEPARPGTEWDVQAASVANEAALSFKSRANASAAGALCASWRIARFSSARGLWGPASGR
jgi:uncharacterized protein (TIGR00369 family)